MLALFFAADFFILSLYLLKYWIINIYILTFLVDNDHHQEHFKIKINNEKLKF